VAKSKRHPARRPQQRSPRPSHRSQPPREPATSAPQATGGRARLEAASFAPLAALHRLPRWLLPVVLAAMLVAGLVLPAPFAVLLLVVAAFLGWLLALSWPLIDGRGRLLRALAVLALVVIAVLRLTGHF
jgi:hypothetical protein